MFRFSLYLCLPVCCLPATALSHDYWLEPSGSAYVLQQGHRHSAHGGAAEVAYDPAIVKAAYCLDGSATMQHISWAGNPVRLKAECAVLIVKLVGGYWTKTPWDTVNQPKSTVKGALESWYAEETLSHVLRWQPTQARSTPDIDAGLRLHLLDDPARLRVGDKFSVLATVDGKTRAGVTVAISGETRGTTDASGRINLRLRQVGRQMLSASLETPMADGSADSHIRSASLSFAVQ